MSNSGEWRVVSDKYLKRKRANKRFRLYGLAALGFALLLLVLLLGSIFWQGISGFQRAEITLTVPSELPQTEQGGTIDYQAAVRAALQHHFPEVTTKKERRDVNTLLSIGAPYQLRDALPLVHPTEQGEARSGGESEARGHSPITVRIATTDAVTLWLKGALSPEMIQTRFNPHQVEMLQKLKNKGLLALHFNGGFFSEGDSREPELAGYAVGIIGSLWTILVCLGVALPLGVMTAVYLEEFAPRHWINDMIEVNINNLAAVPSIVFGLLGLALYLNILGLPRGSALVGGLTLALLVLPVIIIATRAALRAVPPSIRDAARGLGASELQVVMHHVVPLALPGMMTGVILGVARALGETAPLLMIGMVAFIADVPTLPTDPATVMPVQIYLWASSPEIGFVQKTAAAIMVLLVMLLILNLTAVWLRNRFERRW
jgi:phosphate transport system permease protein